MPSDSYAIDQQISELISAYEAAVERLAKREKILEETFHLTEQFMDTQIEKLNILLTDLQEVINKTSGSGATSELVSPDNTAQLQSLRKLNEETKTLVSETCFRFERTSNTSIKQINEAMDYF